MFETLDQERRRYKRERDDARAELHDTRKKLDDVRCACADTEAKLRRLKMKYDEKVKKEKEIEKETATTAAEATTSAENLGPPMLAFKVVDVFGPKSDTGEPRKTIVRMPDDATVAELSRRIATEWPDRPPDRQRLLSSGHDLEPTKRLRTYNLKANATVQLVVRRDPATAGAETYEASEMWMFS